MSQTLTAGVLRTGAQNGVIAFDPQPDEGELGALWRKIEDTPGVYTADVIPPTIAFTVRSPLEWGQVKDRLEGILAGHNYRRGARPSRRLLALLTWSLGR